MASEGDAKSHKQSENKSEPCLETTPALTRGRRGAVAAAGGGAGRANGVSVGAIDGGAGAAGPAASSVGTASCRGLLQSAGAPAHAWQAGRSSCLPVGGRVREETRRDSG